MQLSSLLPLLFLILSQVCISQTEVVDIAQLEAIGKSKKGKLYAHWGYNRSFYTTSDLHFTGPEYDITFYDLKASDRPSDLGWVYVDPTRFTIPQYNFRLGYFLNDHFNISLGVDHMKYVVTSNQIVKLSGVITENISSQYAGAYLNEPIVIESDLLKFEHSDGLNFVSLDAEYLFSFNEESTKTFSFHWNVGMGGMWMITKTNVSIFGDGLDNDFHLSGYAFAVKTGPRVEFKNKFFVLGEMKGGYASLPSVNVKNDGPERAAHNISFLEYYISVGAYFGGKRKKKKN